MTLFCFPAHQSPSGSKFFPYRVDTFPEGDKTVLAELPPLKVYFFFLSRQLGHSSECANMQAELGLRTLLVSKDTFQL